MFDDISELRDFYDTRKGRQISARLRPHTSRFFDTNKDRCNVAFGFALPFLRPDHVDAAMMPERRGVIVWPRSKPALSTLVDGHALPIPDVHVDRMLLVHALEFDPDPGMLLDECWRVLDGTGRLLVMVPHRHGMWARAEKTPFGHGRPYSRRQLRGMLLDHGFEPRSITTALFTPPMATGWTLKLSSSIERIGANWCPALGGILIAEADKMLYAPAGKTSKLRNVRSHVGARFVTQGNVTQHLGDK